MGGRRRHEGVQSGAQEVRAQGEPERSFNVYGLAAAETMVEALKRMKDPTREALMDSVRSLNQDLPILLPGIRVQTADGDGYPIEAMHVQEFNGQRWVLRGGVVEAKR